MQDERGESIADNFYWLSRRLESYDLAFEGDFREFPAAGPLAVPNDTPCFPELEGMEEVGLVIEAREAEGWTWVKVSNPTDKIAFFVRVRLTDEEGKEALPVYWSDNYFSLLPGEEKRLWVKSMGAEVRVDGWNVVGGKAKVVR